MKHDEIKKKIGPFLDHELGAAAKEEVEKHIDSCPECYSELEYFKSQQGLLKKAANLETTPFFRSKLNEKIRSNEGKKLSFDIGRLIPVPIALSVLILMTSVFFAAAPFIYASGNETVKNDMKNMAAKAIAACYTGNVFAPAAFVQFVNACGQNMCSCCRTMTGDEKCNFGGCGHGN